MSEFTGLTEIEVKGERIALGRPSLDLIVSMKKHIAKKKSARAVFLEMKNDKEFWDSLSPEVQKEAMQSAAKAVASGEVVLTDEIMNEEIQEPDNVAYLLWLFARLEDDAVELSRFTELVDDGNAFTILYTLWSESGLESLIEDATEKSKKASEKNTHGQR